MTFTSKNDVELGISDVQIGAVEGKDGASDNRWLISAANTARAIGNMVLAVQSIDSAGAVLSNTSMETSLSSLAGCVAGNEVQVDVLSMPAVTVTVEDSCNTCGNFLTDIPSVGVVDRVQLADVASRKINIQAHPDNTGKVYIGGSTVTNSSGANAGIDLDPGDTYGPLPVENCNVMYVAADTAGDDVKVLWLNEV